MIELLRQWRPEHSLPAGKRAVTKGARRMTADDIVMTAIVYIAVAGLLLFPITLMLMERAGDLKPELADFPIFLATGLSLPIAMRYIGWIGWSIISIIVLLSVLRMSFGPANNRRFYIGMYLIGFRYVSILITVSCLLYYFLYLAGDIPDLPGLP